VPSVLTFRFKKYSTAQYSHQNKKDPHSNVTLLWYSHNSNKQHVSCSKYRVERVTIDLSPSTYSNSNSRALFFAGVLDTQHPLPSPSPRSTPPIYLHLPTPTTLSAQPLDPPSTKRPNTTTLVANEETLSEPHLSARTDLVRSEWVGLGCGSGLSDSGLYAGWVALGWSVYLLGWSWTSGWVALGRSARCLVWVALGWYACCLGWVGSVWFGSMHACRLADLGSGWAGLVYTRTHPVQRARWCME
jgi:hypothetical protein